MAPQESLLKTYGDRSYRHVTMARHQGTTIAFAMDASRRIVYSVLDLSGQQTKGEIDSTYWSENPAELAFPREIAEVGFAVVGPTAMPTVKRGGAEAGPDERPLPAEIEPFLSTTARLTADAPFHVVSDGTYVVVLRQSIAGTDPGAVHKLTGRGSSGDPGRTDYQLTGTEKTPLAHNTLLCDRFLLVDGKLKPALEVRFKRSRHATLPESAKDSLGTEDMEGRPFHEPTQKLSFVRHLTRGRFAAVLVPTAISNVQRWQLFAHNDATGRVDCFNVEQGAQGLFNTLGTRFYTSPDASYRDSVFERGPGTCPFTGRELVPVTGGEGHAETALRLTGTDPYVDLGDPAALRFGGKAYSIEAWIKPSSHDGPVLGRAGEYRLAVDSTGAVTLTHAGAPATLTSDETVPTDVYTHIAATFDGRTAKLYVNGKPAGSGALPFTPATGAKTLIGQDDAGDHFDGDLDELRVWNRVRTETELAEQMNHRLIGNDPGLVAYYRFDEGTGTTAHDQTDNALHGTLHGDAEWTGSDAPVGDHPGVRRDSFTLAGRTVESGMSAVLYHQQENVVAGYRPDPKPAKRQARVMLTFTAKDGQGPAVAALDFAVGRDGRLAQAPDVLDPTALKRPVVGQDSEAISEQQQRIKRLEPEIAGLQRQIAELAGEMGKEAAYQAEYDRTKPGFDDLERRYLAEKDLPTAYNYTLRLKTPAVLANGHRREWLLGSRTDPTRGVAYFNDMRPPEARLSTWQLEAVGESQDGRPWYWLVFDGNLWLRIENDSTAENARILLSNPIPGNHFEQFQLVVEGRPNSDETYVRIVNRRTRLALGAPASVNHALPVQSSECLKADSGLLVMTSLGLRSGLDVQYRPAKLAMDTLSAQLEGARTARQRTTELQLALTARQADLQDARSRLAALSNAQQGDDDLTLAMPLLAVDATGLSLSGCLLDFARGTDRPALLDSGTGNLVLYFRGVNGQFFAVYYDTAVVRGTRTLAGDGGTLSFVARDPAVALDTCTVQVGDGDAPDRCDLTVTVGTVTETWTSLPRKADQLAAALAGYPGRPVTVGTVAKVTGDTVEFTAATTVRVPAKAHLLVGSLNHAASADAPVGAKTLTLTSAGTAIKPGDKVSLVSYDWGRAQSSRPGVLLSGGSRLIGLTTNGVDSVPNGTAKASVTGRGGRWRAEMPGRAFLLDGKDQYLTLPAAKQQDVTPGGDLSLEAWVHPETGQGRLVHGRTDGANYSLALAAAGLPVWQFLGNSRVEPTASLDLSKRDFTVELWAKRDSVRGVREPLLTHGHLPGGQTDRTLCLHFEPNGAFGFGFYADDLTTPQTYTDLEWHHWAVVYRNATRERIVYRDGVEVAKDVAKGAYLGNGPLVLGQQQFTGTSLYGQIDEVRVFDRVRTPQEILAQRFQRLSGLEPGLLGHWKFEGGPNDTASPIKGYQVVARVGQQAVRSAERFPCNEWGHVAATFTQSWAVRLDGGEGLSVASQDSLNILEDLTIEAFVQIEQLGKPAVLVSKGAAVDGGREGVPYQLSVLADGRLEFAFADAAGKATRFTSGETVKPGTFHRVTVVRQRQPDTPDTVKASESKPAEPAVRVYLYLDGRLALSTLWGGTGVQANNRPVEMGRGLRGVLCEVRLWNTARTAPQLGLPVGPRDKGLLACWPFNENTGNVSVDLGGSFPAKLRGARWTRDPDPKASILRLYRNGEPLTEGTTAAHDHDTAGDNQFTLGARLVGGKPTELLTGTLEEVRIWRAVRTQEQISDNLFTRLRGDKQDLLGYWPFDRDSTATGTTSVRDEGLRGNDLHFSPNRPKILLSTAPISADTAQVRSALADVRTPFHSTIAGAPGATEYADLQYDAKGQAIGVLKRCYGFVRDGRWHLITGYKVGDLITEWVGQAQFDPQLMGYIEGAPPVPSENLTDKSDGYAGASSVEFTEADQVLQSLSTSKTESTNTAFNASFGAETDAGAMAVAAPLGFGTATPAAKAQLKLAVTGSLEFSNSWSEDTRISQGTNTARKSKLALTGHVEDPAKVLNSAVGRRYVPANTGMALVQSQTADVFALRLAHTGALVAYRMMPNPDIPPDWNIIHFPINPRYTKQGTLDGAVGFDDRGKVTDPDYPTATGYGEYSYFKPRDAYALKRRITRDQQRLQAFYESISTEIDRNTIDEAAKAQAKSALQSMGVITGSDTRRTTAGSKSASGFSRRDLVNTYVWTAQGGFFAETTEATDAVSETTSGAYDLSVKVGGSLDFSFGLGPFGFSIHLDASRGGSLSLTKARTKDSSRTFGLDVQCAPNGDLQRRDKDGKAVYDAAGKPVLVPGKVDAYRFLTFYLGENSANFDDFYRKVVDPQWLSNSDAPDAAALRQTRQNTAKPPCWRVLHRVTYVSRVLAPVPPPGAPPLEKAMRAENIDSNYELIRRLEPYVRPAATSSAALATATRDALAAQLPELLPHATEIIGYLTRYFGTEN
ncbi:Concanavalin A-like lectin/glucanases superfamily protein [Streptomyces sp. TLI_053]|uniref:LamG domain-containing protein n=1 Tax=Streptomyces sp. TLI_053 TaxID=1855352 RepID=UPI00087CCABF|nr:LamG domain-containing protein [Streptomyces sp. TLI_053]SDS73183.1 Concanavalin A-like lectin/glucanases superfamily protein [Streptomyces sp. TLI_053]